MFYFADVQPLAFMAYQAEREKDMNDRALQAGTDRTAGFCAQTSNDMNGARQRIIEQVNRLNDLGARLLGSDALPRSNRPQQESAKTDAPVPVRADTEKVSDQIRGISLALDDLEEIASFLEQL